MNQLDKKILETCGYRCTDGERWRGPEGNPVYDPEVTTDMLIEAACKEWPKGWSARFYASADGMVVVRAIDKPEVNDTGDSLPSALRAALAAHWGVSDE